MDGWVGLAQYQEGRGKGGAHCTDMDKPARASYKLSTCTWLGHTLKLVVDNNCVYNYYVEFSVYLHLFAGSAKKSQ